MIKNSGLGQLAEAAAGEEFYPIRRRGEKRRLNPNRAAIEWLEADTFSMTDEYSRFLMTDTGGRYGAGRGEIDDTVLVTKTFGANLGSHHSRPMFECFEITGNKGTASYPNPCPNCDNLAYSPRECGQHAEAPPQDVLRDYVSELNRITAPTVWLSENRHRSTYERQAELYAMFTGVDGSEINLSWSVNPS